MTGTSAALLLVIAVVGCVGCGSESPSRLLPAAPSPPVRNDISVTVSLSGKVYDTAARSIEGATIEVLDGAQAGRTTTSDKDGQYWFTGFFEEGTRFSARKTGYVDGVKQMGPYCEPCNPHHWVSFSLGLPTPPMNLSGEYTVKVEARSDCTFPSEARSRLFSATVAADAYQPTAADTYFRVDMGAASLLHGYAWEGLWIAVAADYAELEMGDLHGQPGLVETLDADTYYSVGAWGMGAIGSHGGVTFTMPFDGEIVHCTLKPNAPLFDENRRYACSGSNVVNRVSCPAGTLTFTRK